MLRLRRVRRVGGGGEGWRGGRLWPEEREAAGLRRGAPKVRVGVRCDELNEQ